MLLARPRPAGPSGLRAVVRQHLEGFYGDAPDRCGATESGICVSYAQEQACGATPSPANQVIR